MNSKLNTHIDVNSIIGINIDPSKVEIATLDDQWVIGSANNSSISYSPLDLIQVLDDVDDIILKFRKKKNSIPLDQECYKEIVGIYADIIRELTYYKDELYNKGKEGK